MKNNTLIVALPFILALAACTASTGTNVDVDNTDDEIIMESSSSSVDPNAPFLEDDSSSSDSVELNVNSSSSAAAAPSAGARVITVAVTDWSFSPATIAAKKGEKVQLQLVGGTGIHSFAIPDLDMNIRIEAGQTVLVDLPTDVEGTFEAMCRIPCGPGHKDMKATVVIS